MRSSLRLRTSDLGLEFGRSLALRTCSCLARPTLAPSLPAPASARELVLLPLRVSECSSSSPSQRKRTSSLSRLSGRETVPRRLRTERARRGVLPSVPDREARSRSPSRIPRRDWGGQLPAARPAGAVAARQTTVPTQHRGRRTGAAPRLLLRAGASRHQRPSRTRKPDTTERRFPHSEWHFCVTALARTTGHHVRSHVPPTALHRPTGGHGPPPRPPARVNNTAAARPRDGSRRPALYRPVHGLR